jgi:hypothetical protein
MINAFVHRLLLLVRPLGGSVTHYFSIFQGRRNCRFSLNFLRNPRFFERGALLISRGAYTEPNPFALSQSSRRRPKVNGCPSFSTRGEERAGLRQRPAGSQPERTRCLSREAAKESCTPFSHCRAHTKLSIQYQLPEKSALF